MITPQGAVAFQFDVQGTIADEQVIEPWQADGMVFTPVVAGASRGDAG